MKIYGPVNDGFGNLWQVIGPRGGVLAEFFSKSAADRYIREK